MTDDPHPHSRLQQLLGVWALDACSPDETAEVDAHLEGCPNCAREAEELRGAVRLLYPHIDLELPPTLRAEVLGACLQARPPQVAVPDYARPYDAETARLDGLPDPLAPSGRPAGRPQERTEALRKQLDSGFQAAGTPASGKPGGMRDTWRQHSYELIRTCSFSGGGIADIAVPYGDGIMLPLRLALLDRAFATGFTPPTSRTPSTTGPGWRRRPCRSPVRAPRHAAYGWRSKATAAATGTCRWTDPKGRPGRPTVSATSFFPK
ncbi:anti-sigma factor family protein [Streptomyces boninensis]|uniref:anti-sigma factor family protein n=1 Tax=Streptomyces boninensis TaxID=2039455 RepID=UPI003B20C591